MSFEQMLGLLTSLPHKFLITSAEQLKKDFDAQQSQEKPEEIKVASLEFQVISSDEKSKEKQTPKTFKDIKREEIFKFDKQLKSIRIPAILLERLKKEFDDSF